MEQLTPDRPSKEVSRLVENDEETPEHGEEHNSVVPV